MRPKRKSSGFTIIEVAVALFIVLGGALIFSVLMTMAVKSGKMVGNHQQAVSIVQHKVDQLRAVGFGRLTHIELSDAGIIDAVPNEAPYTFTKIDQLEQFFPNPVGTIQVQDIGINVRQVTVTLVWTGSASRQGNGQMSVTTYISRS